MPEDIVTVAIAALLPLTACMLILQVNPYHALVIRGILGAIAALVYALLGAADVALTEALVGTMLAITLYAVAVRSSLCIRLGILDHEADRSPTDHVNLSDPLTPLSSYEQLLKTLRNTLSQYHMRLEVLTYTDPQALKTALQTRAVHATLALQNQHSEPHLHPGTAVNPEPPYHLQTRIQRLDQILQDSPCPDWTRLTYIPPSRLNTEVNPAQNHETSNPKEVHP